MKLRIGHLGCVVRPMRKGDDNHGIAFGDYCAWKQEIRIDADLPAHRQLEVLLHELLHAAWDAYRVPARVTEEQAVGHLAAALAAVIRANPKLLTVLAALRDGAGFLGD